jgi:hypothetical protein
VSGQISGVGPANQVPGVDGSVVARAVEDPARDAQAAGRETRVGGRRLVLRYLLLENREKSNYNSLSK